MKFWHGYIIICMVFISLLVVHTYPTTETIPRGTVGQTWWFGEHGTAPLGQCNPTKNYQITWRNPIDGTKEIGWVNPDCPIQPICIDFGRFDCGEECRQERADLPNTSFSTIYYRGTYWSWKCEELMGVTTCRSEEFEPLSSVTGIIDEAGIFRPKRFNQTCEDQLKFEEGIILAIKKCEINQRVCEGGVLKECKLTLDILDWDVTICKYGCHEEEVRCMTKEESLDISAPSSESNNTTSVGLEMEKSEVTNYTWVIILTWGLVLFTYVVYKGRKVYKVGENKE